MKTNSFTVQITLADNDLIIYRSIQLFVELKKIICFILEEFVIEHTKFFCNVEHQVNITHIKPIRESGKLLFLTINKIKTMRRILRVGNYIRNGFKLLKKGHSAAEMEGRFSN